jgi:hypothetical protein
MDLERAQTEGQKHGYDSGKGFRPIKSGSLFARQYNDSGVTSAVTRMSMDAQKSVKEFYKKNSSNPDGLSSALKNYGESYMAELPPEMQTPFQMNFDQMSQTVIAQASDNLKKLRQKEAAAQFELYDHEMQNTVESFAKDAFKPGDVGTLAQLSLRDLRKQYAEVLMQHGPEEGFSVGGYEVKAGGGRSGAFDPSDIAEKMIDFDKRILEAGVVGNFQEEVEAGRGVDAYMAFVNGSMQVTTLDEKGVPQSMKVGDLLSNEEMDSISTKMRTFMGGIRTLEEAEYKKVERAKENYNEDFVRAGRGMALEVKKDANGREYIAGGDPAALSKYVAAALDDPFISSDSIDELMDLQAKIGNGTFDDPITVSKANTDIATGMISTYQQVPTDGISDATRVKMYQTIDDRNKGQHWSASVRYKVAEQYADAVLAPEKAAGFNIFGDANSASAADRSEWSKRMIEETLAAESAGILPQNPNAMPAQGQFDFQKRGREIADEIANRRKAPPSDPELQAIDKELKELETKMSSPSADDDEETVAKRYKELQDQKSALQVKKQMGEF